MNMKVTKAKAMGTCFGVDDAIDLALESDHKNDLTILGQLVHNPQITKKLKAAGIRMANTLADPIETKHLMITAHGASGQVKKAALDSGFIVEDASCPLVTRVHKAIKKMVRDGYFPVVIGQRDHVEVRGIVGDLADYDVILTEKEIDRLKTYPKLGIVSQTTQPIKHVLNLVEKIKKQGHEDIRFVDTVCQPTKDRQEAVDDLADQVDIMVVIGGYNSSNTKKLKLVCERKGVPAFHVEGISDIKPEWFRGDEHVGITAGTSTPHDVIEEVYSYIYHLNPQREKVAAVS